VDYHSLNVAAFGELKINVLRSPLIFQMLFPVRPPSAVSELMPKHTLISNYISQNILRWGFFKKDIQSLLYKHVYKHFTKHIKVLIAKKDTDSQKELCNCSLIIHSSCFNWINWL
jgi:hypothetical protein